MHTRKLVKAGVASHTIALPKEWLTRNNLAKGSSVFVYERSPSELIITPTLDATVRPQNDITITVDGKKLDTLQRELTAAYLNNYGSIELTGKSLPSIIKDVRAMLHDFVAIEITEQTGTRLVAKDLLNVEEIAVDKTIRRMDMMLRSLLTDVIADNTTGENARLRDQDINRSFFLVYRLLKRSVEDHALAQRLQLSGPRLLATWAMIHHVENIADIAAQLSDLLNNLKKPARAEARQRIEAAYAYYCDAMKAYFNTDRPLADAIAARRPTLVDEHKKLVGRHPDLATVEFMTSMNTMASLVADIARVVIDEQGHQEFSRQPARDR